HHTPSLQADEMPTQATTFTADSAPAALVIQPTQTPRSIDAALAIAAVTPTATAEPSPAPTAKADEFAIGTSAGGRAITARRLGSGDRVLLLVGGIHGGYEWNTA